MQGNGPDLGQRSVPPNRCRWFRDLRPAAGSVAAGLRTALPAPHKDQWLDDKEVDNFWARPLHAL
jgi:hypothetical protein